MVRLKYDNKKWKSINPTQDMFREYTPVLRFKYNPDDITDHQYIKLYGTPASSRKIAHAWIISNMPQIEKTDDSSYDEPDLYVLHAGDMYGAKPSQMESGSCLEGNDWLASEDSRSIIAKKIDHHLWRKIRHGLKKMII